MAKGLDSSLSPPPEDLQVSAETEDTTKTAAVSRKRKVAVTKTVTTTKRTKKANINDDNDDAKDQTAETPRKKRATAKNVKYEEDSDEANIETTTVVKQTVKQKAIRTKKSKEPVLPLEERSTDTPLRIGAHVSVAGG
jgi:AP endonuclease-1